MAKQDIKLVRVRLLNDGYFRNSNCNSFKVWLKPRTFPVIVKAEITHDECGTPVFAKVPMEELVAIGMNPAIFTGLEMCGLSWQVYQNGGEEAEIL